MKLIEIRALVKWQTQTLAIVIYLPIIHFDLKRRNGESESSELTYKVKYEDVIDKIALFLLPQNGFIGKENILKNHRIVL